jgi:hypothetical protein
MEQVIFLDYWICDKCKSSHYGMCRQCGKCGRLFENGKLLNYGEYPSVNED